MQPRRYSPWCQCRGHTARGLCRMPPAPHVMAALYMEFKRKAKRGTSFAKYLESIGFTDPSIDTNGMDDRLLAIPRAGGGVELLSLPTQKITGELRVIVLMVDFDDKPGVKEVGHYQDLLFSKGVHPTGSMRDFYAEASNGKVDVVGSVHGWLRMPQSYAYYVGNASGTDSPYPNNCKKLAEDAVSKALASGVSFPAELDKLGRGVVTALFIVHSGRGAEGLQSVPEQKREIWSHKWTMENPVTAPSGIAATTYLVVPQDCRIGVCAHELGHLAFQWQDFYDPNYNKDGQYWDGSGTWDLMAGGSHNHNGSSPAHPAVLHKAQHGWVTVQKVAKSAQVKIKPVTAPGGRAVMIVSPAFKAAQYLLLENRRPQGFDRHLPGGGLLVWRVDESKEMFAPATPGMQLVQADGLQQLETAGDYNEGDDGDPFPGSEARTTLKDVGAVSTSFPGGKRSGIVLSNIRVDASGVVTLKVTIGAAATKPAPAKTAGMQPIRTLGKPKPQLGVVTEERLTLSALLGNPKPVKDDGAKKKPSGPAKRARATAGRP